MDKFWKFKAQAEGPTDLYLTEEISRHESWWMDTSSRDAFRRELNAAQGDIRVWIDSPGGDSFAGAAMYDMLREYSASGRGRITAMVSLAASAASLIAMAADEIRISVVGTIMIHRPWAMVADHEDGLRATADVLAEITEAYVDAYVKRTGQSRESIEALLRGSDGSGTYMNARTAIELGFADGFMYMGDADADEGGAQAMGAIARARIAACIDRETVEAKRPGDDPEEPETRPEDESTEALRRDLMRACLSSITDD